MRVWLATAHAAVHRRSFLAGGGAERQRPCPSGSHARTRAGRLPGEGGSHGHDHASVPRAHRDGARCRGRVGRCVVGRAGTLAGRLCRRAHTYAWSLCGADTVEKWGTMPLSDVLEPAAVLAEEGFPVSPVTA